MPPPPRPRVPLPGAPMRPPPAGPMRPPDTRDLVTRRQRNLSSMRSSAYDLTNRVFNVARDRYFGPNTLMPLVYWGQGSRSGGTLLNQGARAEANRYSRGLPWLRMNFTDLLTLNLPNPRMTRFAGESPADFRLRQYGAREPLRNQRNDIIGVLLHELAHTQQRALSGSRMPGGVSNLAIEGGADAFARLALPGIIHALYRQPTLPYRPGYGGLYRQYLRRFGPQQALFGQFGQRGIIRQR